MLRIGGDFQERLGGGTKQAAVDPFRAKRVYVIDVVVSPFSSCQAAIAESRRGLGFPDCCKSLRRLPIDFDNSTDR